VNVRFSEAAASELQDAVSFYAAESKLLAQLFNSIPCLYLNMEYGGIMSVYMEKIHGNFSGYRHCYIPMGVHR